MEIAWIGTTLSAAAAVLAWIAKLRWSREYSAAKEAQIEALRAQVASLQDLTPMKVREYFLSTKVQLEEYIDDLKRQLAESEHQLEQVRTKLVAAQSVTVRTPSPDLTALEAERRTLSAFLTHLRSKLVDASGAVHSFEDPAFRSALNSVFVALGSAGRMSVTVAEDDDGRVVVDWIEQRGLGQSENELAPGAVAVQAVLPGTVTAK